MMMIRPVAMRDLEALLQLAHQAGPGLTSLPADRHPLAARIERSLSTFLGDLPKAEQGYLFVMANEDDEAVGVCGLEVALGLSTPWYNYRVGTISHMSAELGVNRQVPTLFLSNDHTGHSELCTLFLSPAARGNQHGQLLSKSRFLFLAAFREKFGQKIVAEMRGVSDKQGISPFWESLGRHFFSMEFAQADYLTGMGEKSFIAELMPKFPIYTSLLSKEAQVVIGEVHENTRPARAMLTAEGLHYQGYIDIFDGGATLEAFIDDLRMIKSSETYCAMISASRQTTGATYLVARPDYLNFRVILKQAENAAEAAQLQSIEADRLGVTAGEPLLIAPLAAP